MASYTLGQRFIYEVMAMAVVIIIGNSVIANEVLLKTKGHGIGLGFVSLGYGLAFFIAILMCGHVSAVANPALLLAMALVNKMAWKDSLALMCADFIGAFFGAVFVYILYLPHFSLEPAPPKRHTWEEEWTLGIDTDKPSATTYSFISHEPQGMQTGRQAWKRQSADSLKLSKPLLQRLKETEQQQQQQQQQQLLAGTTTDDTFSPFIPPTWGEGDGRDNGHSRRRAASDAADGHGHAGAAVLGIPSQLEPPSGLERESTIQVAVLLHEHEKPRDFAYIPQAKGLVLPRRSRSTSTGINPGEVTSSAGALRRRPPVPAVAGRGTSTSAATMERQQENLEHEVEGLDDERKTAERRRREAARIEVEQERAAYQGRILADQSGKLTCFTNRPAIYAPFFNFMAETLCTFMLIWCALMFTERFLLTTSPEPVFDLSLPLQIGWLVVGLIVSMAGPTGFTANPARDLGPRVAHFFLPIANKGPSEFYYAWAPNCGAYLGGFFGAVIFYFCRLINQYPDGREAVDKSFGGYWS